jgi:hypothetical protein
VNMDEQSRLWETINNLDLFVKDITDQRSKKNESKKTDLRLEVAYALGNKLLSVFNKNQVENGDIVRNISSLRYAFEALIIAKLLLKEPSFILQVFLGLHQSQLKQIENHLARLEREIKLYEHLEEIDSENALKQGIEIAKQDEAGQLDAEKAGSQFFNDMATVDRIKDSHITLWSEDIEQNGYGFQVYMLRDKVLPKYIERKRLLEKVSENRAREMIKNPFFNLVFDAKRQHSKVFKTASDSRSWAQKAEDAGLKDEYDFVYSYTSAIMHCTSYSFMTPMKLSEEENGMFFKLSEQYIRHTLDNLKSLNSESQIFVFDSESKEWQNLKP